MSSFRDDPIDDEIAELINALNAVQGVTTQASCCGHGNDHFYCWLQCSSVESVVAVSRVFIGNVLSNGEKTHYRVEVAPFRLMVRDENQLDMKGNVKFGADGRPIKCVNLIVESDDLCGVGVDIGLAKEKTRRTEYSRLARLAMAVAAEQD